MTVTLGILALLEARPGKGGELAAFLNQDGRAHDMWIHMMQAGEEFLKANLAGRTGIHTASRSTASAVPPTNAIHRKQNDATRSASVSYQ